MPDISDYKSFVLNGQFVKRGSSTSVGLSNKLSTLDARPSLGCD